MLHVYDNGEGELVAADTLEQAREFYDAVAGQPSDIGEWFQRADGEDITIRNEHEVPVTMTAREWAATETTVTQISTTYN